MSDKIVLNDNRAHLKSVLERLGFGHWEIKQYGKSFAALRPSKRTVRLTRGRS